MINENYENKCRECENILKSLRETYLSNNNEIDSQSLPELIISIGRSDDFSCRKLDPCEVCGKSEIKSTYICESCSMDGDGYGSVYKWCNNCGLGIHANYMD